MNRAILKDKKIYVFPDNDSHVVFTAKNKEVNIHYIRSHKTGDAHLLMEELYKDFSNRLFRTDVLKCRKRAFKFWKSEKFIKVNTVRLDLVIYEMEKMVL